MRTGLVSVIIPTYNRAGLIKRAVDSVLCQTYSDLECIVVDDCSSDNTGKIIKSYTDKRVKYFKHPENRNASAARNTGLVLSDGEYIAFQDSDDEWLPQKLEKQIKHLKYLPGSYGMVYCWQDYYDGDRIIHQHHMVNDGMLFPDILSRVMTGGAQTLLIKREVLERSGFFDERITNGDDQDFIRRIARYYLISFVPETLVKIYVNHDSEERLSDNKLLKNNLDLISSYLLQLEKFKDTFRKRPDLKASLYTSIAYHYALSGDKHNFYKFNLKAWYLWPFRGRLKSTLRGISILRNSASGSVKE